ncbi:MAG: hypothetical protein DCF19_06280 [Pseudanabaena frigida]|uniref:SpoVT-AbrB domain-containing protein n=1 Tax=Pseudanabaena frigida TaxID=945775 RepID=A0A2W4WCA1_9CYAN|nr:MAG: hypothetical protein DCF19_06280 [Pseudanabaena frigida]
MQKTITINLTPEGNIQIPLELREQFSSGDQYLVVTTENTITLKKVPKISWDELRKRRAEVGEDPNPLTTEEICEIVREVRKNTSR